MALEPCTSPTYKTKAPFGGVLTKQFFFANVVQSITIRRSLKYER